MMESEAASEEEEEESGRRLETDQVASGTCIRSAVGSLGGVHEELWRRAIRVTLGTRWRAVNIVGAVCGGRGVT